MRTEVLCGLLAEPERLRVFAAVVLGADTPSAAQAATGLAQCDVAAALRRLQQGGLVAAVDRRLIAVVGVFKDSVRESAVPPADEPLRPFVVGGRLVQIPVARGKRRRVLEHIVASFEPGVRYPEREVNEVLHAWHPDHASLRRYLVDEAFLSRENGVYWRIGGTVEV